MPDSAKKRFVTCCNVPVVYKRGMYQQALGLLKESAAKLPNNPEVQYHLGMTHLKAEDTASARTALTAAANADGNTPGKDAAKKGLADLK